jgi:predicted RNA-binding Zn-ribbon protein involved in translation (DUF1610 family)
MMGSHPQSECHALLEWVPKENAWICPRCGMRIDKVGKRRRHHPRPARS